MKNFLKMIILTALVLFSTTATAIVDPGPLVSDVTIQTSGSDPTFLSVMGTCQALDGRYIQEVKGWVASNTIDWSWGLEAFDTVYDHNADGVIEIGSGDIAFNTIRTMTGNGPYTVKVLCIDSENNQAYSDPVVINPFPVTTADFDFTADPDAPVGLNGWYTTTPINTTLTATDDSAVGVTYYCVDQTDTCDPAGEEGFTYDSENPQPILDEDGVYYVRFFSVDTQGNEESVNSETIKIDTTNPVISDLGPIGGFYNRTMTIFLTATDSTSGINAETVWVALTEKGSEGEPIFSGYAVQDGENSSYYTLDVNTLTDGGEGSPIPDGNYDITATVKDMAGRTTTVTVDPIIDNTKPIIESVTVTPQPMVRSLPVHIEARVTDNLSGVSRVWGRIEYYMDEETCTEDCGAWSYGTINLPAFTSDGNGLYSTDLPTDGNFDYLGFSLGDFCGVFCPNWETAGTYVVIIYAEDNASNQAFPDANNDSLIMVPNYDLSILIDSATKTVGENATVSGQLVNDINVPKAGAIITLSGFFGTTTATTDGNGHYSHTFATTTVGDFNITADYNANGYNYHDQVSLRVNAAPTSPSSGGSGGGGGGGFVSSGSTNSIDAQNGNVTLGEAVVFNVICGVQNGCQVRINNAIVGSTPYSTSTQTINWTPTETGSFTAELISTTGSNVLDQTTVTVNAANTENSNANGGNNEENGGTPTFTNETTGNENPTNPTDNLNPTNNGPTGFFGLGNNGSILLGLIALLVLVGGFFLIRRFRG